MRFDDIGIFWEDEPGAKIEKFRPLAAIPATGWKAPRDFPNLFNEKILGLDVETYDPELLTHGPGWARGVGHIVGVSLATSSKAWYFPIRHTIQPEENMKPEAVFRFLGDLLGRPIPKVGANILYDTGWLQQEGIQVKGITYDVQYAEALLDDTANSYALDVLAKSYLGEGKLTSVLYDWCAQSYGLKPSGKQRADIYRAPPCLVGPYAEGDASQPLQILLKQRRSLVDAGLWELFEMECKLIPVLQGMRFRGVPVDIKKAEEVEQLLKRQTIDAQNKLDDMAGFHVDVNIKPDLQKLFDKFNVKYPVTNKGNPSFTKKFLATNASPQAKAIIDIRKNEKMLSTFIRGAILDKHVNNKIFCNFHPLRGDDGGAVSGRYASCVAEDTEVLTDKGIVKIQNISVGDRVFTHKNDYQEVLTFFDSGKKPVYKVTTQNGHQLQCTLEHRILTNFGFISLQGIIDEFSSNTLPLISSLEMPPRQAKQSRSRRIVRKEEKHCCARYKTFSKMWGRGRTQKRSCSNTQAKKEATANRTCSEHVQRRRRVAYHRQYGAKTLLQNFSYKGNYGRKFYTKCYRKSNKIGLQQIKARAKKSVFWQTKPAIQGRTCSGRSRVLNAIKTRLEYKQDRITLHVQASSGYTRTARINRIAGRVCGTSRRRGQNEQRHRQLSLADTQCTLSTASGYSPIRQIDYVGVKPVYDLEIKTNHCYLANGIFVHNSSPNLQNIPSRDEILAPLIRGIFVPEKGFNKWLKADYGQIEYRIFAHVSNDQQLINNYQDPNTDYHDVVSSFLNDLLPRKIIKNFNFMSLFGGGKNKTIEMIAEALPTEQIKTMSDVFGFEYVTDEQALQLLGDKFVSLYAEKFPAAKSTLQYFSNLANTTGEIRTLLNRRSTFNLWESTQRANNTVGMPYHKAIKMYGRHLRRFGTYRALNRITQGGSADILKKGMLDAYEAGLFSEDKLGFPHVTVHDELDFSFNDDLRNEALELKSIMENAIKLKVPVIMDMETGTDWGNIKEVDWS